MKYRTFCSCLLRNNENSSPSFAFTLSHMMTKSMTTVFLQTNKSVRVKPKKLPIEESFAANK
jgi:hypothetical protein